MLHDELIEALNTNELLKMGHDESGSETQPMRLWISEQIRADDCHIFYFRDEIYTSKEFFEKGKARLKKGEFYLPFANMFFVHNYKRDKTRRGFHICVENETGNIYIHDVQWKKYKGLGHYASITGGTVFFDPSEYKDTSKILKHHPGCKPRNAMFAFTVTMACLTALTSREVETCDVPRLGNAKRIGKGLLPKREYSIVKIRTKRPLVREHKGGTHASPETHWRKAHERTLKSGKTIKIKTTLVNWDGKEPPPNKPTKVYL